MSKEQEQVLLVLRELSFITTPFSCDNVTNTSFEWTLITQSPFMGSVSTVAIQLQHEF